MKHTKFNVGSRCRLLRQASCWVICAFISVALLVGWASSAVAGQQQSSASETKTPAPPLTQIYRVGPDDVLEIRLLNDPKANQDYRISPGGYIFFDYVGNVSVAGRTTTEIEEELKRLLKDGYFENPEVTVAVKEYKSHFVYLLGEAANQVVLKHERELLFEILVKSGVRQSARRAVITRMVDGQPTMLTVDLTTNEKYTTVVQHGDIIEVQATAGEKVYMTGEIRTTGTIDYTPGLTLSQAIIQAGGTTEFAKRSKIQVKRQLPNGQTQVLPLANFDEIIRGKKPDIELKPNDTIFVPRRLL